VRLSADVWDEHRAFHPLCDPALPRHSFSLYVLYKGRRIMMAFVRLPEKLLTFDIYLSMRVVNLSLVNYLFVLCGLGKRQIIKSRTEILKLM